jgi:uncharacterized SAM-binding protein YcdF (DUF218 family)
MDEGGFAGVASRPGMRPGPGMSGAGRCSMEITRLSFVSHVVYLLLPPASLVWLGLLALLIPRRAGRWIAAACLVPAVLLAMPFVAQSLLASLDPPAAAAVEGPGTELPGAIVILSGDVERTPIPGELDLGPRERAGAALHRATGLPILVTGGLVNGPPPVGQLMARSLPVDFATPVRWVEDRSATTWENAQFSVPILRAAGVRRVYLVTHAWHMRRALLAFDAAGMPAVPVPVRLDPGPRGTLSEFVPGLAAWVRSYYAVHEWIGIAGYRWRQATVRQ